MFSNRVSSVVAASSARGAWQALAGGAEAETHSTADDRLHPLPVVCRGESPPGWACIYVNLAVTGTTENNTLSVRCAARVVTRDKKLSCY